MVRAKLELAVGMARLTNEIARTKAENDRLRQAVGEMQTVIQQAVETLGLDG